MTIGVIESATVPQLKNGRAAMLFHETGVDLYLEPDVDLESWTHAALATANAISTKWLMEQITLLYASLVDAADDELED